MYAVIRQEQESTVENEIFLLLPKCHKWLCYAVCGNRKMYAVTQQERECTVSDEIFLLLLKCHKWLCCEVCGNRRMYAVIRQERKSTVANEIFQLLPKCHKWLCCAVCSGLLDEKRQVRKNTVPAVNMTFYNSALYIKASQTGSV